MIRGPFCLMVDYHGFITGQKTTFAVEIRNSKRKQRGRQREKQAPCREPEVGLDPGSPGSQPVPLSHPGVPKPKTFRAFVLVATVNIGQDVQKSISLVSNWCSFQEWIFKFMSHSMPTMCPEFQVTEVNSYII